MNIDVIRNAEIQLNKKIVQPYVILRENEPHKVCILTDRLLFTLHTITKINAFISIHEAQVYINKTKKPYE